MKGSKIIFGVFAAIVLIFAAYAALRTVPIGECRENGEWLKCIELPPGFSIDYYAQDVENARQMAVSPNGTLFAGAPAAHLDPDHRAEQSDARSGCPTADCVGESTGRY